MRKKFFATFTAAAIVLSAVLVSSIGFVASASPAGSGTVPVDDDQYVSLHKYVSPTEIKGVFKVTLSVTGKVSPPSYAYTDVIIMLDATGSMNNAGRLQPAKEAAKVMIDTLFDKSDPDYGGADYINVAIVDYGRSSGAYQLTSNTHAGVTNSYKVNNDAFLAYLYGGITNVPVGMAAGLSAYDSTTTAMGMHGPVAAGDDTPEYFFNSSNVTYDAAGAVTGGVIHSTIDGIPGGGWYDAVQPGIYYSRKLLEYSQDKTVNVAGKKAHNQMLVWLNDGGTQLQFKMNTTNFYLKQDIPTFVNNIVNVTEMLPNTAADAFTMFDYSDLRYDPTLVTTVPNPITVDVEQSDSTKMSQNVTWDNPSGDDNPSNRYTALASIAEANILKKYSHTLTAGATAVPIYYIGLGSSYAAGSSYEWLAQSCSSTATLNEDLFIIPDGGSIASDLAAAFKKIATTIQAIGLSNGTVKVTDVIGDSYEIYKFPGEGLLTTGGTDTIGVTQSGDTIQWEMAQITPGVNNTLSFFVKLDEDADPNAYYATNKYAYIEYLRPDPAGGADIAVVSYFPVPYASMSGSTDNKENESPKTSSQPSETANSSGALIPIAGIAGNNGKPYTPSVTPQSNSIQNESLQEEAESVPVTSDSTRTVILASCILAVSAAYILYRKRKRM